MSKDIIKKALGKSQKLWILLAIMLVMTILQPGVFLTVDNMKSILLSISIYGIMVCGTIFQSCLEELTCLLVQLQQRLEPWL